MDQCRRAIFGLLEWIFWPSYLSQRERQRSRSELGLDLDCELDEANVEVPEEFRDPILFHAMEDPVVLCATGQVYDYKSIKEWFSMGNRLCPKTNIEVRDVQVCRLPSLKEKINAWRRANNIPIPVEDSTTDLASLHEDMPQWMDTLRNSSANAKSKAVANINDFLCQVDCCEEQPDPVMLAKLRDLIVDEMVWLVRYGEPYTQGVAASVLGFFTAEKELDWLGATILGPLCGLLFCNNQYACQASARVIMHLSRRGENIRTALHQNGAILGLLKQVSSTPHEFPYCRAMASSALQGLLVNPECKAEILAQNGLGKLFNLFKQNSSRYEKHDAAGALLLLGVTQNELDSCESGNGNLITLDTLRTFCYCSMAWLKGNVEDPHEGFTEDDDRRIAVLKAAVENQDASQEGGND